MNYKYLNASERTLIRKWRFEEFDIEAIEDFVKDKAKKTGKNEKTIFDEVFKVPKYFWGEYPIKLKNKLKQSNII